MMNTLENLHIYIKKPEQIIKSMIKANSGKTSYLIQSYVEMLVEGNPHSNK